MPGWFALVGPAGTDGAIVSKLNGAIQAAIADPAVNKRLKDLYFVPMTGSADAMRARAENDAKVWGEFITSTGVQVD
ncbi:Tripartite tricarboxylate transporter family receptor [compost metagenome]